VLAVENLHWSDPTSAAWLATLAAQAGGAALLLVGTYRPGTRLPWFRYTPPPGALLPGPRHPVRHNWPAGAGPRCSGYRSRAVPHHGHDPLAAPGRGGAGGGKL
jgi:hypothetical protein